MTFENIKNSVTIFIKLSCFLHFFVITHIMYHCVHYPSSWVSDADGLSGHLRGHPARMEHHASRLRQEDAALKQESLRHGDMVFVDVVDTYRNVPLKLLQFYKWYAKC